MPSPLDFTNPNAGFQSLPPEVLQYMQQQGNPMASGLMAPPPPQGGAPVAAPRPPMPTAPATVPQQPVTQPPMGAGQNALLDAGSAMLMNSGTSLGRALGAGLATGKASFEATKNAEEDRKAQQAQAELYYKMLDDPQLGLTPQQLAIAKAMPVAQGMAELAKIGFTPDKFNATSKGGIYSEKTGKMVSPNEAQVVAKDAAIQQPDGTWIRPAGDGTPPIPVPEGDIRAAYIKAGVAFNTPSELIPPEKAKMISDYIDALKQHGATKVQVDTGDKSILGQYGTRVDALSKVADDAQTALEASYAAARTLASGINAGGPQGKAKQYVGNLLVSAGLSKDPSVAATQAFMGQTVQLLAPMMKGSGLQRFNQREFDAYKQAAANDLNFQPEALMALLSAVGKAKAATLDDYDGRLTDLSQMTDATGKKPLEGIKTLFGKRPDADAMTWAKTGKLTAAAPLANGGHAAPQAGAVYKSSTSPGGYAKLGPNGTFIPTNAAGQPVDPTGKPIP